MSRGIVLAVAVWAVGALSATGAELAQETQARFDVQAVGLKIGEMSLSGRLGRTGYDVAARFGTTGLARVFRDMGFTMRAEGLRDEGGLRPRAYDEEVNTGNRTSSARMRYEDGVPMLVHGEVSDGEVEPLDPATQGGTLDPLTAMFAVLRNQPPGSLCRDDLQIFDGGRRTRVRLTGRTETGGEVTCAGQFVRVAGYPQSDLDKRRVVPMTITYVPGPDGLWRADRAFLRTSYGPVGLRRRD